MPLRCKQHAQLQIEMNIDLHLTQRALSTKAELRATHEAMYDHDLALSKEIVQAAWARHGPCESILSVLETHEIGSYSARRLNRTVDSGITCRS